MPQPGHFVIANSSPWPTGIFRTPAECSLRGLRVHLPCRGAGSRRTGLERLIAFELPMHCLITHTIV